MSFIERILGLLGAIIEVAASLIMAALRLITDIGRDGKRPGWVRLAAILLCLVIISGLAYVFWTWIVIIAVILAISVAIAGFFTA